ncbi:MAG: hypothetical protein GXC73_13535 [Chitinophagaceae bacterium]|nr:hypothetical protein [Chitinophagaceae bacterium]
MKYVFSLMILLISVSTVTQAQQLFSVPDIVKQTFDKQYPDAKDLKWSGGLDNHIVRFTSGDKKLKAVYTPKGDWVSTEEQVKLEALPEVVQQGFKDSKYKEWAVKDVLTVTKPRAEANEYFIIVQKNAINKKKLVFDAKGRLYEELLSL